jgi:outer membrane lipoprotein-sorting protein
MRHLRQSFLAVGLVLSVVAPIRADDAKATRGTLDKAIKAHGGADTLKKFPASVSSFKGTFYGMGMELPMSGEVSISGLTKLRMAIDIDAGGQKFKVVNVIDGEKGWTKLGDAVTDLDKDQIAEANENLHAGWVASLVPLIDAKGYTLAATGEHTIAEKKAVGVKVSAKGKRDIDLYFDKESGKLVRFEHRVKDEGSGQEVSEETTYSDFKEVQGVQQAMKVVTKRDGKPYLEIEVSDVTLSEKLDDGVFVKP